MSEPDTRGLTPDLSVGVPTACRRCAAGRARSSAGAGRTARHAPQPSRSAPARV